MRTPPLAILALLVALVDTGCREISPRQPNTATWLKKNDMRAPDEASAPQESNAAARSQKNLDSSTPIMAKPAHPGSGVVSEIRMDKFAQHKGEKKENLNKKGEQIVLDFTDTSLRAIIESTMNDYLKVPFTFTDDFKDKNVNLVLHASATKEDLIALLQSFIEIQGAHLRYTDGIYIISGGDGKGLRAMPSPEGIGDAIGIFRLRFIDAKDFLSIAKQVLSNQERASSMPSYNAVTVVAPAGEVRAVKRLIEQLDIPYFTGKQVILYSPRFLSAKGLTAMVEAFQDQLGSTAAKPNRQFEIKEIADAERVVIVAANQVARDVVMEFIGKTDNPDKNRRQIFQYSLGMQKAADLAPNIATLLKSLNKDAAEFVPVADKESNSILFVASPDEYAEIRRLMVRFDQRPMAVYISVIIAEVALNDSLQYGVEWFLGKIAGQLVDVTSSLATGGTAMVARLVSKGTDSSYMTLDALAQVTSFSILSNPQIIVRNNTKATITVGGEQPVVQGQVASGAAAGGTSLPATQFTNLKTGLEVEVTPNISTKGEVKLEIKIADIRLGAPIIVNTGNGNTVTQYPTVNRKVATDLVVEDGSTIFLGGFRQRQLTENRSKIPELGDLPLVGRLFSNKNDKADSTELIILVTPTVLMDQHGAELVTRAILNASGKRGGGEGGSQSLVDKIMAESPILPSTERVAGKDPAAANNKTDNNKTDNNKAVDTSPPPVDQAAHGNTASVRDRTAYQPAAPPPDQKADGKRLPPEEEKKANGKSAYVPGYVPGYVWDRLTGQRAAAAPIPPSAKNGASEAVQADKPAAPADD